MQPVNVFLSGGSERGTNVSRSVSCTIDVNCPGMHKHTEGAAGAGGEAQLSGLGSLSARESEGGT